MPTLPATRDATGAEYLTLVTDLLHDVRLADPAAGVWEAADLQWWSRRPRPSDAVPQRFWYVDGRPVAVAALTWWAHGWALDVIVVPGADVDLDAVWEHGLRALDDVGAERAESLVDVTDADATARLAAAGFTAGDLSGSLHGSPSALVPARPLPPGYELTDRGRRPDAPHPMVARNGSEVGERLARTSLYDASLDLAVLAPDAPSPVTR